MGVSYRLLSRRVRLLIQLLARPVRTAQQASLDTVVQDAPGRLRRYIAGRVPDYREDPATST
jgi:hypothetical protein